jgi:8-oxo-dGTP diphosphatase
MSNPVNETYGNRIRLRACGICVHEHQVLMVNHRFLSETDFWSPPGGGIEFGESAAACLMREFKEETGLDVRADNFLFTCEFIRPPLHAIEFFFAVTLLGGVVRKGTDPEADAGHQLIADVKFLPWNELKMMDPNAVHGAFRLVDEPVKISDLRGYFRI